MTSSSYKFHCMCPIKLRTKPAFRIFLILKINRIMQFCNLFIERPSYITASCQPALTARWSYQVKHRWTSSIDYTRDCPRNFCKREAIFDADEPTRLTETEYLRLSVSKSLWGRWRLAIITTPRFSERSHKRFHVLRLDDACSTHTADQTYHVSFIRYVDIYRPPCYFSTTQCTW